MIRSLVGWYKDEGKNKHHYIASCGSMTSIRTSDGKLLIYSLRIVDNPVQFASPIQDTSYEALYQKLYNHPGQYMVLVASCEQHVWGGLYDTKERNVTWEDGTVWTKIQAPRLVSSMLYIPQGAGTTEYDFFENPRILNRKSSNVRESDDTDEAPQTLVSFE